MNKKMLFYIISRIKAAYFFVLIYLYTIYSGLCFNIYTIYMYNIAKMR